MFIPSIENIKSSIKDNNNVIDSMNKFILENYQKRGDHIFEHRIISSLLDFKRRVISNSQIIKAMIWSYLLNRKEECKGKKFWLYVKLYTHRKIIQESLINIKSIKIYLDELEMEN